jgi:hypothetical protein
MGGWGEFIIVQQHQTFKGGIVSADIVHKVMKKKNEYIQDIQQF